MVKLEIRKGDAGVSTAAYFSVSIKTERGYSYKRFNIQKLGYEKAFRQAVELRARDVHFIIPSRIPLFRPSSFDYVAIMNLASDIPLPVPVGFQQYCSRLFLQPKP